MPLSLTNGLSLGTEWTLNSCSSIPGQRPTVQVSVKSGMSLSLYDRMIEIHIKKKHY